MFRLCPTHALATRAFMAGFHSNVPIDLVTNSKFQSVFTIFVALLVGSVVGIETRLISRVARVLSNRNGESRRIVPCPTHYRTLAI